MIRYAKNLQSVVSRLDFAQIGKVVDFLNVNSHRNIFVVGNGGSQATAEHFVTDLLKMGGMKAHSISNCSLFTMASNDFGYGHGFSWLLTRYCASNDIVIGITTSGKSENIVRSLIWDTRVKTVLITGAKGKKFAKQIDFPIVIDSENTQIIEDVSLVVCHMISVELCKRRKNGK